jgi:hypothetical protein
MTSSTSAGNPPGNAGPVAQSEEIFRTAVRNIRLGPISRSEYMDIELLDNIRECASNNPGVQILSALDAERVRGLIADRFGFPLQRAWWWETVTQPAAVVDYGNGSEGIASLLQLVASTSEPLFLFVTDDEPPPWFGVAGSGAAIADLLRSQRFFEYFVVNRELTQIVFDTHHNRLIKATAAA